MIKPRYGFFFYHLKSVKEEETYLIVAWDEGQKSLENLEQNGKGQERIM